MNEQVGEGGRRWAKVGEGERRPWKWEIRGDRMAVCGDGAPEVGLCIAPRCARRTRGRGRAGSRLRSAGRWHVLWGGRWRVVP